MKAKTSKTVSKSGAKVPSTKSSKNVGAKVVAKAPAPKRKATK